MLKGSCLCKLVKVKFEGELEHQPEACHCVECRKQTSSFFTGVNVRRRALSIQGEENIRWYRSSEKVERGFCSVCGSTLFWKPNIKGYQWISVAMGLLDQPTGTQLVKHTFVSEKGDYYDIKDDVLQHNNA